MYDVNTQPQYNKNCQECIDLICPNCDRELPNKEHRTKNGCKSCDVQWYRRKK